MANVDTWTAFLVAACGEEVVKRITLRDQVGANDLTWDVSRTLLDMFLKKVFVVDSS